ncbi:putative toxin-antitoxin system toxin component, PIN family [Acidovorax sp. SDU_ACID1]|uniref:putative toxin-antitoxin system toxin component, PIN family n=1 Tax=Acidovorax sp. SDU_ACID1 TaxID=3136632 RepID=UPI0038731FDC
MTRVVLDTNVVLSALLFTSGRLAWIRRAWQHKQLQPLVCKETVSELLRVLAYPKFKLTAEDRQELVEDFLPFAEAVQLPQPWPTLPACRDEKDQMFLVLARVGQARLLITGDSDLLAMRDEFPNLIVTPDEWARQQDCESQP